MRADNSTSNSRIHVGVGVNKKVFCRSGGSTTSLSSHPHLAQSIPAYLLMPGGASHDSHPHCVSCSYGESTKISPKDGDLVQLELPNPPIGDLDFILVGLGEKGINCGIIFATHICENLECMKVHYSKQRCLRRACPECYRKWLVEERENITARILSKDAMNKNNGRRLVEITLSPDPRKVPNYRYQFDRLIKEGYQYIKKKGVKGGCAIIHPFRATPEAKRLSWESNEKTWKWIRKQKNPGRYFYYSPHLHLLAYVEHLKKPQKGEEWIYKTKTNENGKVIDFLRKAKREHALRNMIGYFLSHTATLKEGEGKFHSVRWFGTCSYNKFETTEEEREVREERGRVELRCKICGYELMPFWKWVWESYGDVFRDIVRGELNEPRYWDEVMSAVGREDPPPDAEKYLI